MHKPYTPLLTIQTNTPYQTVRGGNLRGGKVTARNVSPNRSQHRAHFGGMIQRQSTPLQVAYSQLAQTGNGFIVLSRPIVGDKWHLETSSPTLRGAEYQAGMLHRADKAKRRVYFVTGCPIASLARLAASNLLE